MKHHNNSLAVNRTGSTGKGTNGYKVIRKVLRCQ